MAALSRGDLRRLIALIQEGDDPAWSQFIDGYAPLLLQAARSIERDRDAAADAFVFICERLRERRGARLATFDFDFPGSFETWLRAVALNLTRDAKRHRHGRFRPFAMVKRFPPLEQRVFRLRYELGLTFDQIFASLQPEFPGLTESRLAEADALVSSRVSTQHRWALLNRRPRLQPILDGNDGAQSTGDLASDAPDPEWLAIARESHQRLSAALAQLSVEDRLLVRLHVERGVTLSTLATMFGLSNAQAAHRRLRNIFNGLRQALESRCDGRETCP